MNRRSWMKWIPAALLPMAVKGQSKLLTDEITVQYDPPQWRIPLSKIAGRPRNGQCPVCGTMSAAPDPNQARHA